MADLDVYRRALGLGTIDAIVGDFLATLTTTNRYAEFFVDWPKVERNVEELRNELNILNRILRSNTSCDARRQFEDLVRYHPETVRALPLLIACRDSEIEVVPVNQEAGDSPTTVRFTPDVVDDPDGFQALLAFCEEAGIFSLFADRDVNDLVDYVMGVEVGLDTHARKNRGGDVMERQVEPLVAAAVSEVGGLRYIPQCTHRDLQDLGYQVPVGSRKMDFVILASSAGVQPVNLETNFFNVSGSKQDVITGYVDRQSQLHDAGWHFILVTDGPAWKEMRGPLTTIVSKLDFVVNLSQARRGMLREILASVMRAS